MMTPAPARKHQAVLSELHGAFWFYLKKKNCKIYPAPFDVRLPKNDKSDEKIFNVLQPDLTIICDRSKLDGRGCVGAPDMVIDLKEIFRE